MADPGLARTDDFSNPTMGTTDTIHYAYMDVESMAPASIIVDGNFGHPETMEELRMAFWWWIDTWFEMILYSLFHVELLFIVYLYHKYHINRIRQPKPKSRLRARLYK